MPFSENSDQHGVPKSPYRAQSVDDNVAMLQRVTSLLPHKHVSMPGLRSRELYHQLQSTIPKANGSCLRLGLHERAGAINIPLANADMLRTSALQRTASDDAFLRTASWLEISQKLYSGQIQLAPHVTRIQQMDQDLPEDRMAVAEEQAINFILTGYQPSDPLAGLLLRIYSEDFHQALAISDLTDPKHSEKLDVAFFNRSSAEICGPTQDLVALQTSDQHLSMNSYTLDAKKLAQGAICYCSSEIHIASLVPTTTSAAQTLRMQITNAICVTNGDTKIRRRWADDP